MGSAPGSTASNRASCKRNSIRWNRRSGAIPARPSPATQLRCRHRRFAIILTLLSQRSSGESCTATIRNPPSTSKEDEDEITLTNQTALQESASIGTNGAELEWIYEVVMLRIRQSGSRHRRLNVSGLGGLVVGHVGFSAPNGDPFHLVHRRPSLDRHCAAWRELLPLAPIELGPGVAHQAFCGRRRGFPHRQTERSHPAHRCGHGRVASAHAPKNAVGEMKLLDLIAQTKKC
jgi:hypothetical protein